MLHDPELNAPSVMVPDYLVVPLLIVCDHCAGWQNCSDEGSCNMPVNGYRAGLRFKEGKCRCRGVMNISNTVTVQLVGPRLLTMVYKRTCSEGL